MINIIQNNNKNMETKELKIQIPEGMEIDKENSTFECIKFKPIEVKKTWENIGQISGYVLGSASTISPRSNFKTKNYNKDIAASEKVAKSMLAMAQLSQVLKRWYKPFTERELRDPIILKWGFGCDGKKFFVVQSYSTCLNTTFLAFRTKSDALEFLENNRELIKQYYML